MTERWDTTGIGTVLGEALIRLLQTSTIDKISVKDICEEAHVNRSTFYNYIDDKYQLLDAVMFASTEVFIEKCQAFVDEWALADPELKQEYFLVSRKMLIFYLELVREYRGVYRSFAMHHGTFSSNEQYDYLVRGIVLPMLEKYSIHDERMADYMTTFYLGAIHSIVSRWLENDCSDPPEYIADIIRLCLRIPDDFFRKD